MAQRASYRVHHAMNPSLSCIWSNKTGDKMELKDLSKPYLPMEARYRRLPSARFLIRNPEAQARRLTNESGNRCWTWKTTNLGTTLMMNQSLREFLNHKRLKSLRTRENSAQQVYTRKGWSSLSTYAFVCSHYSLR